MALTRVTAFETILSAEHNEIVDLLNGTSGGGQPVSLTQLSSASFFALELRNQGAGGFALRVKNAADSANLLQILDSVSQFDGGTFVVDNTNDRVGINTGSPSVDLEVNGDARIAGFLSVFGTGVGGSHGLQVTDTGQIGMLDSGGEAAMEDEDLVKVSYAKSSSTNQIMVDNQFRTSNPGTQTSTGGSPFTGTASSGSTSTLVVGTTTWTVNGHQGKIVRINSGTGAGQHRIISSNTNNTLTVAPNWTAPDNTSNYTIVDKGDESASRFNGYALANNVADIRGAEIHATRYANSGEAGTVGLELGIHVDIQATGNDRSIALNILSQLPDDFSAGGFAADLGILLQGNLGYNRFIEGRTTAGVAKFYFSNVTDTPILYLKQNGNSVSNGIRFEQSGGTNYGVIYMGTDNALYFVPEVSSAAASAMALGGGTGAAGFLVNAITGLTANLATLAVGGVTKVSVRADGLGDFTTAAVATFAKAGVPSDADWGTAPPTGTLVVDTTNNRIYARTAAATWKQVAIA